MAIEENEVLLDCTADFVSLGGKCYQKMRDSEPEDGEPAANAELEYTSCETCLNEEGGTEPPTTDNCITTVSTTYDCDSGIFSEPTYSTNCGGSGPIDWQKKQNNFNNCTYEKRIDTGAECDNGNPCTGDATVGPSDRPDPATCDCPNDPTFCVTTHTIVWNCNTDDFAGPVTSTGDCLSADPGQQGWERTSPTVEGISTFTARTTTSSECVSGSGCVADSYAAPTKEEARQLANCFTSDKKCISKYTYKWDCSADGGLGGESEGVTEAQTIQCENPTGQNTSWHVESTSSNVATFAIYIIGDACDTFGDCTPPTPPAAPTDPHTSVPCGGDTIEYFVYTAVWDCVERTFTTVDVLPSSEGCDTIANLNSTYSELNSWMRDDYTSGECLFTYVSTTTTVCSGTPTGPDPNGSPEIPNPETALDACDCPDTRCVYTFKAAYDCQINQFLNPDTLTGIVTDPLLSATTCVPAESTPSQGSANTWLKVGTAAGADGEADAICLMEYTYYNPQIDCGQLSDCPDELSLGVFYNPPSLPEPLSINEQCGCSTQPEVCFTRFESVFSCADGAGVYDKKFAEATIAEHFCGDPAGVVTDTWELKEEGSCGTATFQITVQKSLSSGLPGTVVDCEYSNKDCESGYSKAPALPSIGVGESAAGCTDSHCYASFTQKWNCDMQNFESAPTQSSYYCSLAGDITLDTWIIHDDNVGENFCEFIHYKTTNGSTDCNSQAEAQSCCSSREASSIPGDVDGASLSASCTCYVEPCRYDYTKCEGQGSDGANVLSVECDNVGAGTTTLQFFKHEGVCYGGATDNPLSKAERVTGQPAETFADCGACLGLYTAYKQIVQDGAREPDQSEKNIIVDVAADSVQAGEYLTRSAVAYIKVGGTGTAPGYTLGQVIMHSTVEQALSAGYYHTIEGNCGQGGDIRYIDGTGNDVDGKIWYSTEDNKCYQDGKITAATAKDRALPGVIKTLLINRRYQANLPIDPANPNAADQTETREFLTCAECEEWVAGDLDSSDSPSNPPNGGGGSSGGGGPVLGSEISESSGDGIGSLSETVTPESSNL